MVADQISIEPHWPGMRKFALQLFIDDPKAAQNLADAMGSEAPGLPDVDTWKRMDRDQRACFVEGHVYELGPGRAICVRCNATAAEG